MLTRSQFLDLNFADALPALREIIQNKYEQKPSMISELFNVEGSKRSIEQSTGISGFRRFAETAEGDRHASDLVYERFDKTYEHKKFTLGFALTRELIDDDQFGVVSKFSQALGRSAYDTRETHGAEIFNDAFTGSSFTGGDAKPLCADDHPLISGTARNELATSADLSVTSLQQAIIDMQDTVDDRGLLINVKPKWLLVPNELQFIAHELLKSQLLPDTANNNVNSLLTASIMPATWDYLTDADAWFLVSDKSDHDVTWYDRDPFQVLDYDEPSIEGKVIYGRMRYSRGFNDWRGIFGSPGA